MNSFLELWTVATSPVNIVPTVLVGLVAVYWLLTAVGMLDFDSSHHGDLDLPDTSGPLDKIFHFLHFGEVPVMAVLSVLILTFWTTTVSANYYLNPQGSALLALLFWLPGIFVSMLLTRWITAPMRKLMKTMRSQAEAASVKMIGLVCEITSSRVDPKFGTARVRMEGAPLLLNIRAEAKENLQKGDKALIISEDPEKRIFKVVRYQPPEEN